MKLSADIEKKPGPCQVYVDPSKTIAAPYSQGNECCWTMCCNEFVLFDLQQQTRNQFCKWPHSNNEHCLIILCHANTGKKKINKENTKSAWLENN